jgi:hypothetical protein
MGDVLRQKGDLEGAVGAFCAALKFQPNLQVGYYSLGSTLRQMAARRQPSQYSSSHRVADQAEEYYKQGLAALAAGDVAGARVRIVTGRHAQMEEVISGSSFLSQSDLRLHFGLGQAKTVDLVEVTWPSGTKESFRDVQANQLISIEEGRGIVKAQPFRPSSRKSEPASTAKLK